MKLIKISLNYAVESCISIMYCKSFEKKNGIQWEIIRPSGAATYYDARKWNLYEYSEGWKKQ